MAYDFDFNWTNDHLFYGQYEQGASYFDPTELAAKGLHQGQELEVLEPFRDKLPPEVFTQVYDTPSTDGQGWPRENLLKALDLLDEAGWEVRDFKLVNKETGQPFRFEVMIRQQDLDRVLLPYQRTLARIGIEMSIRFIDTSQYVNRLRSFDYDMIIGGIGQALSPGNEQREYWGSQAANQPGSRNISGIDDFKVGDAADAVVPTAEDVGGWLIDQLGVNTSAILLNTALIGGGAALVVYGISMRAGVSEPTTKLFSAIPAARAARAVT